MQLYQNCYIHYVVGNIIIHHDNDVVCWYSMSAKHLIGVTYIGLEEEWKSTTFTYMSAVVT